MNGMQWGDLSSIIGGFEPVEGTAFGDVSVDILREEGGGRRCVGGVWIVQCTEMVALFTL